MSTCRQASRVQRICSGHGCNVRLLPELHRFGGDSEKVRMPLLLTMADRNVRPTRVFHGHPEGSPALARRGRRAVLARAAVAVVAGGLLCVTSSKALGAAAYWDVN